MFVSDPVGTSTTPGTETLREERHGVVVDRPRSRLGQRRPVEPALAVHVIGDAELPNERALGTTGDGHIGSPGELRAP